MAFTTHRINGENHKDLIAKMYEADLIQSDEVFRAMYKIDRGFFSRINPYADGPQLIGYGATISAPHIHATALEILKNHLVPGERALDIGCGSGYLTACMAIMMGKTGQAIGIDHIPEIVRLAESNVNCVNNRLMLTNRVVFLVGDGRLGFPPLAPYNAIHVGASSTEIPKDLLKQLKVGGRLLIPIGNDFSCQHLLQIDKVEEGRITQTYLMDVAFVPLTDKERQMKKSHRI